MVPELALFSVLQLSALSPMPMPAGVPLDTYNSIYWGVAWAGSSPYETNADALMQPASVVKIITASTALRVLGPQFKFVNTFQAKLNLKQGVLFQPEFTLSSDPTWGHPRYETLTARMDKIVQSLKQKKVRTVIGPIQLTFTRPELLTYARPAGLKKSWILECHNSFPTPIIIHENCATLAIYSLQEARWLNAGVSTPVRLKLVSGKTNRFRIEPVFDSYGRISEYEVSGSFFRRNSRYDQTLPVQINDDWLKKLLVLRLKKQGISFLETGRFSGLADREANGEADEEVAVDVSSKPLSELMIPFLQESLNLIGDRLAIESAAVENSSIQGDSALRTLRTFVRGSLLRDVVIQDGSGLNQQDLISARVLNEFLEGVRNANYFMNLIDAFAVAGVSGTMRNRLTGSLTRGKVFAKTGTLNEVANLAGYFYSTANSIYEPFTILTRFDESIAGVRQKADAQVISFAKQNGGLR